MGKEAPGVSVIVPAYNEAERIAATVRALLSLPGVDEVLVVDDGSSDATAQLARRAGARVYRLPRRRGKGAALRRGVEEATRPVLAFVDADLGETAMELTRLLEPVLTGTADMTIARFPETGSKGGFGLVVTLARGGIFLLTGWRARAPLSGQRVLTRRLLEEVGGLSPGFGVEVGLTIDALRRGFRVLEIETQMAHRATGRDWRGFLHRGRQFIAVGRALLTRIGGGVRKRHGPFPDHV